MKYKLLILAFFIGACYGKKPEITNKEGKPLPSFNLLLSDSSTWLDTKNIPTGKPIAFFLFGPKCPYSKSQMKEIIENITELKEIRLYIFTAASFRQMDQFYEEYHLNNFSNITVGIDPKNFFGQYMEVPGVPYIAIYDSKKRLKKAFSGETESRLIKAIAEE